MSSNIGHEEYRPMADVSSSPCRYDLSHSHGINKVIESLQKKFPSVPKVHLRSKVKEISEFSDNRWQVSSSPCRYYNYYWLDPAAWTVYGLMTPNTKNSSFFQSYQGPTRPGKTGQTGPWYGGPSPVPSPTRAVNIIGPGSSPGLGSTGRPGAGLNGSGRPGPIPTPRRSRVEMRNHEEEVEEPVPAFNGLAAAPQCA
ncbi:Chromatin assembly factor 1 subunit [Nymphaea thermarum]|nr:Chromatin assembly factor 1 subunit [Nymphaea thermarum]